MKYLFVILVFASCSRATSVKFEQSENIRFGSDTLNFPLTKDQLSIQGKDTIQYVKVRKTYKL